MTWLDSVLWNDAGLIPAIAQDAVSGEVLTLAWMNRDALERTAQIQLAHYWSRSRGKLWRKGEQSGNTQRVLFTPRLSSYSTRHAAGVSPAWASSTRTVSVDSRPSPVER